MDWLKGRPWWQQALAWLFLWPIFLLILLWRSELDRNVKIGVTAAAVVAFILIGVFGGTAEDDDADVASTHSETTTTEADSEDESTSTSTTVRETTTTDAPTTTTTTTAAPTTTTAPPTQAELIEDAVDDALGSSNRDHEPRFTVTANPGLDIIVTWAINENLTEGLTKDSARLEAVDILRAVTEAATDYTGIRVEGTFPLVDQFGNASEERVVLAAFTRETLGRFNWDRFDFKKIFEPNVADEVWLHPAFEY